MKEKKYSDEFLARNGSRILQRLSTEQQKLIINKMATNLVDYSNDILGANKRELEEATKEGNDLEENFQILIFYSRSQNILT